MKVLLIIPPRHKTSAFLRQQYLPPVGLAYCSSYALEKARQENFPLEIEILDCTARNIGFADFEREFKKTDPDVAGLSFFTENRFDAMETIKIIKRIKPSIITVAGGTHATLATDDTIRNFEGLDFIVRGEGEMTFFGLLLALKRNEEFSSVKGISYRYNGEIFHNPDNDFIKDLDSLPFPAYELLDMKIYYGTLDWNETVEKMGMIFTSRGCPYRCNFCSSAKAWGNSYRMRSPENIIKELRMLKDKYATTSIMFFDDTMTVDKNRALEICKKIRKAGLNIKWKTHARVDTMNSDLMLAMRNAGCSQIMFGVESGSQRILDDVIHKRIRIDQVRTASRLSKEAGMENNFSYIVGHPTETMEEAKLTLGLIKEHIADKQTTHLNFMRIYPNTGIETYAIENRLLPDGFRWSRKMEYESGIVSKTLKGDVPMLRDKLSWNQMFEINSIYLRLTHYPVLKHALDAVKNISSFHDVVDLVTLGITYLKALVRFN